MQGDATLKFNDLAELIAERAQRPGGQVRQKRLWETDRSCTALRAVWCENRHRRESTGDKCDSRLCVFSHHYAGRRPAHDRFDKPRR